MVPVFCDQVVAMLVVESDTWKRNLEIPLDIFQENVVEDFTLQAQKDFKKCAYTCDHTLKLEGP